MIPASPSLYMDTSVPISTSLTYMFFILPYPRRIPRFLRNSVSSTATSVEGFVDTKVTALPTPWHQRVVLNPYTISLTPPSIYIGITTSHTFSPADLGDHEDLDPLHIHIISSTSPSLTLVKYREVC
jgi:hypothetical protein